MISEYIGLRKRYDMLLISYFEVVSIAGQLSAENRELKRLLIDYGYLT